MNRFRYGERALGICALIATVFAPLLRADTTSPGAEKEKSVKGDGTKAEIAEHIETLGEGDYNARRKAIAALAAMGADALPALEKLIRDRDARMGHAFATIGAMGTLARAALEDIIKVLQDRETAAPEGWTWNVSPRQIAASELAKMRWAAARIAPVLIAIVIDETEDIEMRRWTAATFTRLGDAARDGLERFLKSSDEEIRESAHYGLAEISPLGRKQYFKELLESDPCHYAAADFLGRTKGIFNSGRLDSLTERVKQGLRECIAESKDPRLVHTLAMVLSNQLSGTALMWAAPTDSSRSRSARENPRESYHTMREVLELGFELAEEKSSLRSEFGVALAKLHLLLGDWKGMNLWLETLGKKPIDPALRPLLAAPPDDWSGELSETWTRSDESMRGGDSTLVFRFEKDGRGLAGAHVLVKEKPKPQNTFRSGIAADTLFLNPTPFSSWRTFGYLAADRPKTRYAVSDASGIVHIEKLPAIEIKIEVLVPTGNFKEEGSTWELWMETSPGEFKLASNTPVPGSVSSQGPPAIAVLAAGEVTEYPRLVVKPRSGLNVHDFASVSPSDFVLRWEAAGGGAEAGASSAVDHYEVTLALSALHKDPDWAPKIPTLIEKKAIVRGASLEIGARGVDGLRLAPGNFYWLRVTALDASGEIVFRSDRVRVWTPWPHRRARTPLSSWNGTSTGELPLGHGQWWRASSTDGSGKKTSIRDWVESFLKSSKTQFEYEYVLLGRAWLDWRDEKTDEAKRTFGELARTLPEGNVVRATARSLLDQLEASMPCPKRLNFVGE